MSKLHRMADLEDCIEIEKSRYREARKKYTEAVKELESAVWTIIKYQKEILELERSK